MSHASCPCLPVARHTADLTCPMFHWRLVALPHRRATEVLIRGVSGWRGEIKAAPSFSTGLPPRSHSPGGPGRPSDLPPWIRGWRRWSRAPAHSSSSLSPVFLILPPLPLSIREHVIAQPEEPDGCRDAPVLPQPSSSSSETNFRCEAPSRILSIYIILYYIIL